jgi:hypothetical protein
VRVLLHLLLLRAVQPTSCDLLRCYYKLWRHLARPFCRKLPRAAEENPLYGFFHNTASNVNNLFPVFQAARTNRPGAGEFSLETGSR